MTPNETASDRLSYLVACPMRWRRSYTPVGIMRRIPRESGRLPLVDIVLPINPHGAQGGEHGSADVTSSRFPAHTASEDGLVLLFETIVLLGA